MVEDNPPNRHYSAAQTYSWQKEFSEVRISLLLKAESTVGSVCSGLHPLGSWKSQGFQDGTVSLDSLNSQVIHDTLWPEKNFLPSLNSFKKCRGLWDLIDENWSTQGTSTSALPVPTATCPTQQQVHTFLIQPFPISGRNSSVALSTTCSISWAFVTSALGQCF